MSKTLDLSLYLVTDSDLCAPRAVAQVVEAAVSGGVTLVQLRDKEASSRDLYASACALKAVLDPHSVPLIVNDRVDIALAAKASGVHLGQSDLPYKEARRLMGPKAIIGLSVDNMKQLEEAEELDADYLAISPVFYTATKSDIASPWGLEGVREAARRSTHQLVGIGGINHSNAAQVIEAGALGIAVVSAICSAEDPLASARELRSIIRDAAKSGKRTED